MLIGGQAVNYWAETYLSQEPALAAWLPFTSKDIDFQGGRDDVLKLARALGVRAQLPHRKEMTAFAGGVPFHVGDLATKIEFVRHLPGVENAKIEARAMTAQRDGKELRVLDPISLLSCKLYLALRVDQSNRRDADHARIMIICVRAFLRETLRGVESGELSARGWLAAVERVLKLAESNIGRKTTRELGVDWSQALPLDEIATSSHRAAIQLREKRLPRWKNYGNNTTR